MKHILPSILALDYLSFKEWTILHKDELNPVDKQWLDRWEIYDLAVSPMNDQERGYIRLGHFLGWFEHSKIACDKTTATDRRNRDHSESD